MLNKIILMGRLTRDPELRRTESGTAVVRFQSRWIGTSSPKTGKRRRTLLISFLGAPRRSL